MSRGVTQAGHDPDALMVLIGALAPYVEETELVRVAVDVFGVLHDAGLRLVPSDERQRAVSSSG